MSRCAVRLAFVVSRSSWARLSVRDLTAALVALYEGFPLIISDVISVGANRDERVQLAHGGLVMPCLDPVLMMTAGFSWCSMLGTNVCCTFRTLNPHAGGQPKA